MEVGRPKEERPADTPHAELARNPPPSHRQTEIKHDKTPELAKVPDAEVDKT
jgi:hypothetical protein